MGSSGGTDTEHEVDPARLVPGMLGDMAGLRARLTRVTRNPELAADILQDAVVTVLQKLKDDAIPDRTQLGGYVYRVALNHLRNYRRKHKSTVSQTDEAAEAPEDAATHWRPSESLESAQWAKLVTQLLGEVRPERDRELLVRFYLHEESKERLCEHFGLTALHFNRVIGRARDRFRELMARRGLGKSDFLAIGAILVAVGLTTLTRRV